MHSKKRNKVTTGFTASLTRRSLLKVSGLTAIAGLTGCDKLTSPGKRIPLVDYASIGVKPVINSWGTMTILSGSLMLPEIKAAMMEASEHYVDMD